MKRLCLCSTQVSADKKELYLSVNAFSTKVLIGDTLFMSPATADAITILHDHLSHTKV